MPIPGKSGLVITSHAVSLIDPTVYEDGRVTFSVPSYYVRRGRTSKRQVVETGENGERVSDTLTRALDDEISARPGSAELQLVDDKPFHVFFGRDEKHPGGTHLKLFYFVRVTGERRTEPKQDGEEEVGPIVDLEAETLIVAMEKEGTVPIHLEVTKIALQALALKHENVYHRYAQLLSRCSAPHEPTVEEWEAIYAYEKYF